MFSEFSILSDVDVNFLINVSEKIQRSQFNEAYSLCDEFIKEKPFDIRVEVYYLISTISLRKIDEYIIECQKLVDYFLNNLTQIQFSKKEEKTLIGVLKQLSTYASYTINKELTQSTFTEYAKIVDISNALIDSLSADIQQYLNKFRSTLKAILQYNSNNSTEEYFDEELNSDCKKNILDTSEAKTLSENTEICLSPLLNDLNRLISLYKRSQSLNPEVAYLLSLEIDSRIKEFDPIKYFPNVFKEYINSKVNNFKDIHLFSERQIENLPYAKMVSEILNVDSDIFIDSILENKFSYAESTLLEKNDDF